MHIPDGMISPVTSLLSGTVMLPLWATAAKRLKSRLAEREVPLLALGSAFCFTIMLFNLPTPGGTTAHAVGATLFAILLGPWAALIGVSVTLAIQALFFGDGGVAAFGANCLCMACVQPFVGYGVYRIGLAVLGKRSFGNLLASALGAYCGINAGAFAVAVLLGAQPLLFHSATGSPLYCPFRLSITLPAMLLPHLLVIGVAEASLTALVIQNAEKLGLVPHTLQGNGGGKPTLRRSLGWVALCGLVVLAPFGLLAQGTAWGEWDKNELAQEMAKHRVTSAIPAGIEAAETHRYKGIMLLQNYASERGAWAYLGAGLFGASTVVGVVLAGGRTLTRKEQEASLVLPPVPTGQLPDWLKKSETLPTQQVKTTNPYLERTLGELSHTANQLISGEEGVHFSGLLQALDVRSKLLGFALLIGVSTGTHSAVVLVTLFAVAALLAFASRLPMLTLGKRLAGIVMLFGVAVALPVLLWGAFSQEGRGVAATLLLRLLVIPSWVVLLTSTTRWSVLLSGLHRLGMPKSVTALLSMTYRYLLLGIQTSEEMLLARKSRRIGQESAQMGRQFVGFSVVALFGKTLSLSQEVHFALVSRGFQGDFPHLTSSKWQLRDTLFILFCLLVSFGVWRLS